MNEIRETVQPSGSKSADPEVNFGLYHTQIWLECIPTTVYKRISVGCPAMTSDSTLVFTWLQNWEPRSSLNSSLTLQPFLMKGGAFSSCCCPLVCNWAAQCSHSHCSPNSVLPLWEDGFISVFEMLMLLFISGPSLYAPMSFLCLPHLNIL